MAFEVKMNRLEKLEKDTIKASLKRNRGHVVGTAASLGIPYARLYQRLYKYSLWPYVTQCRQKAA